MEAKATRIAQLLGQAQETRRQWEAFTEPTRRLAIAADLELRRRHPEVALEPMRSAERPGLHWAPDQEAATTSTTGEVAVQLTLDGTEHLADPGQPEEAAAEPPDGVRRELLGQLMLGLTPETVHDKIPDPVLRIQESVRVVQEKLDQLRGVAQYAEHDDSLYLGPAWGDLAQRERDAVLQPARPDIVPASVILKQAREREFAVIEPEHG
jgi:hypothetical protein